MRVSIKILFLSLSIGIIARPVEVMPVEIEPPLYRIDFDNDYFLHKDNQITAAWSFQKHSSLATDWSEIKGIPGWVTNLGQKVPTINKVGLYHRCTMSVGQIMQTPEDLTETQLIKEDVPYAGALLVQTSWYSFNAEEFRGFEIAIGVLGPPSLVEHTQRLVHKITGSAEPKGWDNQLKTEPLINLNYMRKYKVMSLKSEDGYSFDATVNGNLGIGNMFTQGSVSIELRMGYNVPEGFVYTSDPIGFSMFYEATLPAHKKGYSLYLTVVTRGTGFLRNIFFDGNTFTDSHSVDKKPFVGQCIWGLHYERKNYAFHFNVLITTPDVDKSSAPLAEGRERWGSVVFEWRF